MINKNENVINHGSKKGKKMFVFPWFKKLTKFFLLFFDDLLMEIQFLEIRCKANLSE